MKTFLRKLSDEELRRITSLRDSKPLGADAEIFNLDEFLKEVPILVEGHITIMKNNEECLLVTPGYALGLRSFISNTPCLLKCKASNAKAIFASRNDFELETDDTFCSTIRRWFLSEKADLPLAP